MTGPNEKALVEVGGGNLPAAPMEVTGDPGGLVALAIQNQVPVEVLEKLVALQERVADRTARAEFFLALADFQEQAPEITKTKTADIATRSGSKYEYTYAPLEAITRAIRPVLKANGLSFAWTTEDSSPGALNVVCVLRHIGGHEERATFPVPTETKAAMSGAQKSGAALTYGKRQSLTSVLGLTTADEDTDGADPRQDPDAPTITKAQAKVLAVMVKRSGTDEARFLDWLEANSLEAVLACDFDRATDALKKKEEKAKAAEGAKDATG